MWCFINDSADIKRLLCRVRSFCWWVIFVSCSLLLKFMGVSLLLVSWMALSDFMMFAHLTCKHFALILIPGLTQNGYVFVIGAFHQIQNSMSHGRLKYICWWQSWLQVLVTMIFFFFTILPNTLSIKRCSYSTFFFNNRWSIHVIKCCL